MYTEMVGITFPGQGSQYKGMGKDFYEEFSLVRDIFRKGKEILGWDPEIMFEAEEEKLAQTSITQPLIFLLSFSIFQLWKEMDGCTPSFIMGHSLGEYTALSASEVFNFEEGLRLVKKRGELMERAKKGVMSAILGLEREKVEKIVEEAKKEGIIVTANYNSPLQTVISGEEKAVRTAEEKAKEYGAKRVVRLKVSGAFHSPLMKEAGENLKEFIDKIDFSPPLYPVIMNVTAKEEREPEKIKENLIRQMVEPVRWVDSVKRAVEKGVKIFIEMGPGKVLKSLIKKTVPGVTVYTTDNLLEFKSVLSEVKK